MYLTLTERTCMHATRQKFRQKTPIVAEESVKLLGLLRGFAVNGRWSDVLRVIRDMKAMGMQQEDLVWGLEIRVCFGVHCIGCVWRCIV